MIPSDHFVKLYNEIFKFLAARGQGELDRYYDCVANRQAFFTLEAFRRDGLKGMYDYWERIRLKQARGVLCAPLTISRAEELSLPHQVQDNTSLLGTPFTVTVDKIEGCTTGVSAHDRCATIRALADPRSKAETFARPGHINPLYAQDNGVLRRSGHTEAAIDLCKLCGLQPVGALIEIMNEDGSMARMPELQAFAKEHNLKIITIKDLIAYRLKKESLIEIGNSVDMPTKYGHFRLIPFRQKSNGLEHMALIKGEWGDNEPVLVRVHSSCATGDILGSMRCDCGAL